MPEIWVIDDNEVTRRDVKEGLEERIVRDLPAVANQWSVIDRWITPHQALAALAASPTEDRALYAAVFDLYTEVRGQNIRTDERRDTLDSIKSNIEIAEKFAKSGIHVTVYSQVILYFTHVVQDAKAVEELLDELRNRNLFDGFVDKNGFEKAKDEVDEIWNHILSKLKVDTPS